MGLHQPTHGTMLQRISLRPATRRGLARVVPSQVEGLHPCSSCTPWSPPPLGPTPQAAPTASPVAGSSSQTGQWEAVGGPAQRQRRKGNRAAAEARAAGGVLMQALDDWEGELAGVMESASSQG